MSFLWRRSDDDPRVGLGPAACQGRLEDADGKLESLREVAVDPNL